MWTSHDTLLVLYAVIAIAGVIALITLPVRVQEFFGMSVADTIKSWSVMETIISVAGFALVLVASAVV